VQDEPASDGGAASATYPDRTFTLAVRDSADVDGDVIRIEIEDRTNPDNSVVLVESLELSGSYCEPIRFTVAQPVDTVVRVTVLQDSVDPSQAGASGVSLSMRVEDMLEGLMWDQTYEQFAEYAFITITLDPVLPEDPRAASRPEDGSLADQGAAILGDGTTEPPVPATSPVTPRELLRLPTDAQAEAIGRIAQVDLATIDPQLVGTTADGWTSVSLTKSDGCGTTILSKRGPFGSALFKVVDGCGVELTGTLPVIAASTEHGTKKPNLTKPSVGLSAGVKLVLGATQTTVGLLTRDGQGMAAGLETSLGRLGLSVELQPQTKVPLGGGVYGPEAMASLQYVGKPFRRPDGVEQQSVYRVGAGASSGFGIEFNPKRGRAKWVPGIGLQVEAGIEVR